MPPRMRALWNRAFAKTLVDGARILTSYSKVYEGLSHCEPDGTVVVSASLTPGISSRNSRRQQRAPRRGQSWVSRMTVRQLRQLRR